VGIEFISKSDMKFSFNAVSWFRWLVAGIPPPRRGFIPRFVNVGFLVNKVALGRVFLNFGFPLAESFSQCSITVTTCYSYQKEQHIQFNEARSRNHCCRGKATSITYSGCVYSCINCPACHAHLFCAAVSVACAALPYFSPHDIPALLIRHITRIFSAQLYTVICSLRCAAIFFQPDPIHSTIFGKKLLDPKYILIFSTSSVWKISHSKKKWARYHKFLFVFM